MPHGKQGKGIEVVRHNLDVVSALMSAFLAVMVRKHPDLKDEMTDVLQECMSMSGLSLEAREALSEALSVVGDLATDDQLIH